MKTAPHRQTWQLIWELAKTDFKLRYSGSHIGFLWALLFPLLSFLILNFVLSRVFTQNLEHYPLHLLTGLVLWTYFNEGTTIGMNSLISKQNLIMNLAVPKVAIIFSATLHASIIFALNIVVLLIFFYFYNVPITAAAATYGLLFAVVSYLFVLGFSLAAAPLYVLWRDLGQVWGLILRLGFFAAPIVYPLNIIPSHYQVFLWLNPMAYVIHYAKRALIKQEFIQTPQLIFLLALTATIIGIGSYVFYRTRHTVTDHL